MRFFLMVTLAVFLFGSVGCVTLKPGDTATPTSGSDIVGIFGGKLEAVEYAYAWHPRFYYIVDPRTETCWFSTNSNQGDTNSSLDCCKARRVKELRKVITWETDETCPSTTTSSTTAN